MLRKPLVRIPLHKPVFVVGSARSGTTFLGNQLGRLPDILHCPFELKDIWSREGKVPMASPKTGDRINPCLTGADTWPGQAAALSKAFQKRMQQVDPLKAARPACRLLNKNPHLANKIGLVHELFPDADFIWIHRPLPDVVASLKAVFADVHHRQKAYHVWPEPSISGSPRGLHLWAPGDPPIHESSRIFPGGAVSHLAEYWLETNTAIKEAFKTVPNHQKIGVDHAALLKDPEAQFRRLCRFFGQPESYAATLSEAVSNTNGRWRTQLTDSESEELLTFMKTHRVAIDHITA